MDAPIAVCPIFVRKTQFFVQNSRISREKFQDCYAGLYSFERPTGKHH
jgi:hypothetical protein